MGGSFNDGRVEYCEESVWRAMCDDEWDMSEALVVCKEVGQHSGCKDMAFKICLWCIFVF